MSEIIYTHETTKYDDLLREYRPPMVHPGVKIHEGAFKKRMEHCPHCDYKRKDWLVEKLVTHVIFMVDLEYGPIVNPEEAFVVITKCPRCKKSNIYHERFNTAINTPFLDQDKIREEMKRRNLNDRGFKEKDEMEKTNSEAASIVRLQRRVMETQAMVGLGVPDKGDDEIPDFEIPCWGSFLVLDEKGFATGESKPCKTIWTKENSNPRWMSPQHLVARCPDCGAQSSITKELKELGFLR